MNRQENNNSATKTRTVAQKKTRRLCAFVLWALCIGVSVATILLHQGVVPGWEMKALKAQQEQPSFQMQIMGRYVVGAYQFYNRFSQSKKSDTTQFMGSEIKQNVTGDLDAICLAIITAELNGKQEAIRELRRLEISFKESPYTKRIASELIVLYRRGPSHLSGSTRERLNDRLGWYYDLACSYGRRSDDPLRIKAITPAEKTFSAVIIFTLTIGMVLIAGIILCICAIVFIAMRTITSAFQKINYSDSTQALLFFEGFTFFMVFFFILKILSFYTQNQLLIILNFLFPLTLLWIKFRGVSWSDFRKSLGLIKGKGIFREVWSGVVGFIAGIPIIITGALIVSVLIGKTGQYPVHPIIYDIEKADAPQIALVLLFAGVVGPISEELIFRGAFYRYLRDRYSIPFSVIVSGILFAALHPQGLFGMPVLALIGINLALIREWRGSITASIVSHGLTNTMVILFTFFLIH